MPLPGREVPSSHTTDHMTAPNGRIEVITRGERRRNWTTEQKREMAIESLVPGAVVAEVARKHEIGTGQLYTWRRQLPSGELGRVSQALPRFLPVDGPTTAGHEVASEPPSSSRGTATGSAAPPISPQDISREQGLIEIILTNGICVRVGSGTDEVVLRRVLAVLEGR